jgi:hypothetical protein
MAKSFKYCPDCECSHYVGECGGETPQDRRQDRKRRERVRETEYSFQFIDPMVMDP